MHVLGETSEFLNYLQQIGFSFLERITFLWKADIPQGTKEAIEKFDYAYITKFCMANTTHKVKRQMANQEQIFAIPITEA